MLHRQRGTNNFIREMKTCLIISGGEYSNPPSNQKYDYCIAVDRGYEHALYMGIKPDVLLGDFDSMSRAYKESVKTIMDADEIITFPKEKDDTDTLLAIKRAIDEECDDITIICALGGRLDHTLANIQCMKYASTKGVKCEIISDSEYLRTITRDDGRVNIPRKEGYSLSLFALSDVCTGISIEGAKYNVEDIELRNDFPLGHGNDWIMEEGVISVGSGVLLIVESMIGDI